MAERLHGKQAPPTDRTVAGADWADRALAGETHERVAFVDLDLTEARCRGMTFTECTFRRARFNCSSHADAAFVNCTFVNCNFFDARFADCKLVGSMFDRCTYDLMQVSGGNWSHVGLPGADLSRAAFRGTRLREADLTGASFKGGTLRDADLSGALLRKAKLAGCDLRGSDLSALEAEDVMEMRGAVVTFEQALVLATVIGLDLRPE
jgi:fluoroquinolone resistance protein